MREAIRSLIFKPAQAMWRKGYGNMRLAQIRACKHALIGSWTFFLALLLVAGAATFAGGVLAGQMLTVIPPLTTAVLVGPVAEVGGLWLRVESGAWEHPTSPRRLHVQLTLQNPTDRIQAVGPKQFRIGARNGQSWPADEGSFAPTRLGPKQALSGALVFDLPGATPGLQLVWTQGHHEVYIPLEESGIASGHDLRGRQEMRLQREQPRTNN
ncbi:MAG TPA: hypothetical protein VLT62_26330 [Candidatus Methylomirabilis sp.]|nr:hypothetical protein [Candidatus Methylomirabilis sp.]